MDEEDVGGSGGDGRSMAEGRDWSELTPVLLINVFRRLTLEDRWRRAMLVCKPWFDAARDPSLFEGFDLESYFSGWPDSAAWWTPAFQSRIDGMLRSAADWGGPAVRTVRVRHCSDRALELVAERCPNLEILSIRSSQSVTDVSLFKIAFGCHALSDLDTSSCYEISYKSLEVIGQNCPNLTVLKRNLLNCLDTSQHAGIVPDDYLNSCPQDGDMEAYAIARFMPKLKHLELRFSKISINGLITITEGCREIEALDLFGCANLTGRALDQASANLKNLQTLVRPNFYIPRSVFHTERYGHWRLYDERFQTNVFQI